VANVWRKHSNIAHRLLLLTKLLLCKFINQKRAGLSTTATQTQSERNSSSINPKAL